VCACVLLPRPSKRPLLTFRAFSHFPFPPAHTHQNNCIKKSKIYQYDTPIWMQASFCSFASLYTFSSFHIFTKASRRSFTFIFTLLRAPTPKSWRASRLNAIFRDCSEMAATEVATRGT